jgi:hypothetical protein
MTPISPTDVYKQELNRVIKQVLNDQSVSINFNTATMSQHVANNQQAQSVVVEATRNSAQRLVNAVLSQEGVDVILNKVSRNTAYSAVLGVMSEAVNKGTGFNV